MSETVRRVGPGGRNRWLGLATAGVVVLALAGCGDDGSRASYDPATPISTSVPAPDPTQDGAPSPADSEGISQQPGGDGAESAPDAEASDSAATGSDSGTTRLGQGGTDPGSINGVNGVNGGTESGLDTTF